MKIAILVGVEEYDNLLKLPACRFDIELMEKIIKATKKYADILCIKKKIVGAEVKQILVDFLMSKKGEDIEEVFFYYTGHGYYYEGKFYYLLSDYAELKIKQTSLDNTDIDNLIRNLSPSLTIKVIDACQSGLSYIKHSSSIKKYLADSRKALKNCYFLFSSRLEQNSYQDDNLSYFTKSFAKAIRDIKAERIRYVDIIDYISDDFKAQSRQTPYFVTQGEYTEVFCTRNEEIRKILSGLNENGDSENQEAVGSLWDAEELIKRVEADSKDYIGRIQTVGILEELKQYIKGYDYSESFEKIYSFNPNFHKTYSNVVDLKTVAEWIDSHPRQYFVKITRDTSFLVTNGAGNVHYDPKNLPIGGFETTIDLPYTQIQLVALPKFPNIPRARCTVLFLISKSSIRFFYQFFCDREYDWGEFVEGGPSEWKNIELRLGIPEQILEGVDSIVKEFEKWIFAKIQKKLEAEKNI